MDGSQLRAAFDTPEGLTVGLEEEVMLLDPESLELVPRAHEVLGAVREDARFKLELPASQVEIVTSPHATVAAAVDELAAGRQQLVDAVEGRVRFACAGAHPFSAPEGELVADRPDRERMIAEYGIVARRQLVCALQVQVAPGGADAAIAVHDALRSFLPELAALAANAPFFGGRDTGLASVRPKIAEGLPRQGVPPALGSLDRLEEVLSFGRTSGAFAEPGRWWWELRPNVRFGTLELRVPDAQATVADGAAVAAVGQCLVAWLCAQHAAGERLPAHERWRIEENRWSACRYGVSGELIDLESGVRRPTRERLLSLFEDLEPTACRLRCEAELELARALVATGGGAGRQRESCDGARAATSWLAERFAGPSPTEFSSPG